MTIAEIQSAVASYLDIEVADMTINGQDQFIIALNQVRKQAELMYDFEFQRTQMTLSVNGVTGGSLEDAVEAGTGTSRKIKTIIEVGLYNSNGDLCPVEWTTVSEGLARQREDNRWQQPRYPQDDWYLSEPRGLNRFTLTNSSVYRWPRDTTTNFSLGFEVYYFWSDWTIGAGTVTVSGITNPSEANGVYTAYGSLNSRPLYLFEGATTTYAIVYTGTEWVLVTGNNALIDPAANAFSITSTAETPPTTGWSIVGGTYTGTLAATVAAGGSSTEDTWTLHASEYLIWGVVCMLNNRFKHFVYRQEGNVSPPEKQRDMALEAFKEWDSYRYELNRRHGR